MSLRDEKIKSLLGTNLDDLSEEELKKLCNKILASKIHGICFSLYEGCLLYTSPSPRDRQKSRMPSSA